MNKSIENKIRTSLNRVINMFADIASERHIKELLTRFPQLADAAESIDQVYVTLKTCFVNDKILFCAGNGGSGADSEHITGELMKGFRLRRPVDYLSVGRIIRTSGDQNLVDRLQMGLRCIYLLSHPALNTAFMNDVDPDLIFAQQLFVLGRSGDAVIGISTSGNAVNICNMFKVARSKQISTILLTGSGHGAAEKYADQVIHVPESETYKIQELHLPVYHCLCSMLEDNFYGK